MFKCHCCNKDSKTGDKRHMVITETRNKVYKKRVYDKKEREHKIIVEGEGVEIVKEVPYCSPCFERYSTSKVTG